MPKTNRQRGTAPGRHHVGTPGDIISECPGFWSGFKSVPVLWLGSGVVTPTWFVPRLIEPAAPPTFTRSDLASSADSAFTLEAMSVSPAGPF